jgi:hypothetical protein
MDPSFQHLVIFLPIWQDYESGLAGVGDISILLSHDNEL